MVQAIQVRSVSIPEVPDNFHIEILYNEAEAHFDLRVPINTQYPCSTLADNCVRSFSMINRPINKAEEMLTISSLLHS